MSRKTRRKRLEPWEQFAKERRDRGVLASRLSGQYPNVAELRFEFSFQDDRGEPLKGQSRRIAPDQRAFFEFECPLHECICGGFDLTDAVARMIQAHQSDAEGRIVCQGWQDTERYQQYHCMAELTYRIAAIYV